MLCLAAVLVFLTGIAHAYLSEQYILVCLFRRDGLPKLFGGTEFTTGTLRFAWHLTTVDWWGLACLIVLAARPAFRPQDALQALAVVAFVSGALPLYFSRGKPLSWIVFFAVALLLCVGIGIGIGIGADIGAGAVPARPVGAGGFTSESRREDVEGAALLQAVCVWRPAQGKR